VDRPVVRCLIAFPNAKGEPGVIYLVDMKEAEQRMRQGWIVVGPDPADLAALAKWQRDNGGL
jgi:hypothetical protein